ncbi:ATP-binding protein [Sphingosinicella sp.]|uniref:ATP-binding protein n=1 Tax=Sphingosinicella sp. TaxID=1917971 RepID=UPI0018333486|nr:ATP-binding protein [Sphingosinicella sp.]MBA4760153.1 ATP-binding protein [Sphingosinicella sp.]
MPELRKPDMAAVLARTNLARHIGGFLLPVFEAVSNSIHSITDKYSTEKSGIDGKITIRVTDTTNISDFKVSVLDNGKGLDSKNFEAFLTPFTGNKLRKNGKGFGRFIAFKVFEAVEYESKISEKDVTFRFDFNVYRDEEIEQRSGRRHFPFDEGCLVTYSKVKSEYHNGWKSINEKSFLDQITQNFLTYLVDGSMPQTEVIFNGNSTDLRSHFLSVFKHEETHDFHIDLEGEKFLFKLDVSRVDRGVPFNRHTIIFFADNRILGQGRSIEGKLGRAYFEDTDEREYVIIASVSGEYLDRHANNDRTFLEASEDDIKEIIDAACALVLKTEKGQNELIKSEQKQEVLDLLQSHPLLRFGLDGKTIEQYVKQKPNSWKRERFVSDLAVQRLRAERRWDEYVQETVSDEALFKERKDKLLEKVTDTYRDALSEYVVHRRAVLEIAEGLRRFTDEMKMSAEDAVHQLIFPRNSDTTETKYYQHNLWLLDERLSFVSYASSDRTLHGGRRSAGDKVVDIAFYDEIFVAGGDGTSAVMIVEFKKPGRNDYSFGADGRDPIKQINDTVRQIRERGSFVTKDGATITVSPTTQITAYVVADLEPSLRKLSQDYDFKISWDSKSLFNYHESFKIYTEVFGYDKLLEDAKRRNGPFFDVLLSDIGH